MRELSFRRHRVPPDIVRHAIRLYARLTSSFRDVEGMRAPAAAVLAELIQLRLPPSFRRSETATVGFLMDLHGLTKRQLRRRIAELMEQMANLPDTVADQLAARERISDVLGVIAERFERAAADVAERQGSTD